MSSVTRPPALRRICASPDARPKIRTKPGFPHMASVFDPKSTVPVVSGGRRRPELEQWRVIGGRIGHWAKKRLAEGS
jgi:hypothetical protein